MTSTRTAAQAGDPRPTCSSVVAGAGAGAGADADADACGGAGADAGAGEGGGCAGADDVRRFVRLAIVLLAGDVGGDDEAGPGARARSATQGDDRRDPVAHAAPELVAERAPAHLVTERAAALQPDTTLRADLGIGSLGLVELGCVLQDGLGMDDLPVDAGAVLTVADVEAVALRHLSGQAGGVPREQLQAALAWLRPGEREPGAVAAGEWW